MSDLTATQLAAVAILAGVMLLAIGLAFVFGERE